MQKRMIEATQVIPGVTQVGLVDSPPMHMGWGISRVYSEKTTDVRPANALGEAVKFSVSPEYLGAAQTTLLAGRNFSWHDDKNAPQVVIVNQLFARKFFGSVAGALGSYYKKTDGVLLQIVGVVEDGKYTANIAEEPQPAMFLSILQSPSGDAWLVVRSNRDPQQVAAALRSTMRNLDAGLPVFTQTWNEEMSGAMFASRIATASLGMLGIMGAMLSITGIFGMAAYSVSRRLRELGIRIALGAQRVEVLHAALGRSVKLLAWGSGAGLILGILASRVLSFIVYEATPRDPLVLTAAVLAMALLGLVATWLPAQRALSVDPLQLLREE
jgi:ABC-type antimicrobial peptide transport system permease subunit